MASIFTHAAVGIALAPIVLPGLPARVLTLGALVSVLPDADVIGLRFGIPYRDPLGHRGFTHSLAFAAALALLVLPVVGTAASRGRLWIYLALATASHGVLDALTNGGVGIAFFAPFSNERYFFPVRPIEVSPIGIAPFFSEWGRRVIVTELIWVWLPVGLAATIALFWRRRLRTG